MAQHSENMEKIKSYRLFLYVLFSPVISTIAFIVISSITIGTIIHGHSVVTPIAAQQQFNIIENSTLRSFSNLASESVVEIINEADSGYRSSLGSGFVYDANGHIVTNSHVIDKTARESDIKVTFLGGTALEAKLVGYDEFADLAVLLLQADEIPLYRFVPLPMGNSDSLNLGQAVVAIGSPFGLSGSITQGTITGLGRLLPSPEESEIPDIIQTNAPLNPGNSGGPLLDIRGQVIGINTAINSPTGQFNGNSFAIPSNTIKKVVSSLITTGSYQHPYLGILGINITPEIAQELGLGQAKGFLVTDVSPDSPAENAGIHKANSMTNIDGRDIKIGGDVILKVDGKTVTKINDILTILEKEKKAGDSLQLTVFRNGITEELSLTLGAKT